MAEDKGVESATSAAGAESAEPAAAGDAGPGKKKSKIKIDIKGIIGGIKSILLTAVIALAAVICSYVYVTKYGPSKDAYNIADITDVAVNIDDVNVTAEDAASEPGNDNGSTEGEEGETPGGAESAEGTGSDKKEDGVLGRMLVPMESIVVNLGSVDSRRYLRVIVNLEVDSEETEKKIVENKVIFRDKLVAFLSTKDAEAIGSASSQINLRVEIKDLLNDELLGTDNAITQVYFSDFIVQ